MNNFQSILDNGIFLNSSGTTGKPKSLFQPPKKLNVGLLRSWANQYGVTKISSGGD